MNEYIKMANSMPLYLVVAVVLGFVAICCVVFIAISYKAGVKLGMEKRVLKKTITSSALFTKTSPIYCTIESLKQDSF